MAEIWHPHLVLWDEKKVARSLCWSQDYVSRPARLPANQGARHWTFDES